jgi:cell division cycle 14
VIYFYCKNDRKAAANAATLMGGFAMIYLKRSAARAIEMLTPMGPFTPFRDASMGMCAYKLMPEHCMHAIADAMKWEFFDFETFDVDEYEHYECVENGDFNTIINRRFLAFVGPHAVRSQADQYPHFTPEDYAPIFTEYGVQAVVRLNAIQYEAQRFVDANFAHYNLFFLDGTTPSDKIVTDFLNVCNNHNGLLAIHCKAGLGRTGTLMGMYMMCEYRMTASAAIAWIRICRPGSVIGPQQFYLENQQARMWALGKQQRTRGFLDYEDNKAAKQKAEQQTQLTTPKKSNRVVTRSMQGLQISTEHRALPQGDRLNFQKLSRTPGKNSPTGKIRSPTRHKSAIRSPTRSQPLLSPMSSTTAPDLRITANGLATRTPLNSPVKAKPSSRVSNANR